MMVLRGVFSAVFAVTLLSVSLNAMQQGFYEQKAVQFIEVIKEKSGDHELKYKEQLREYLHERLANSIIQDELEIEKEVRRMLSSEAMTVNWDGYDTFMSKVQPNFAAMVEGCLGFRLCVELGCYINNLNELELANAPTLEKVSCDEFRTRLYSIISLKEQKFLHLGESKKLAESILLLLANQ